MTRFLILAMGLAFWEAKFVFDPCRRLEHVEWTWGSSVIALKLWGFDEALVEGMDLELWLRTWCLWERLDSLGSNVLWHLCTVEALWRHLTAFGPWGPTPFWLALLFVAAVGWSWRTLLWASS